MFGGLVKEEVIEKTECSVYDPSSSERLDKEKE